MDKVIEMVFTRNEQVIETLNCNVGDSQGDTQVLAYINKKENTAYLITFKGSMNYSQKLTAMFGNAQNRYAKDPNKKRPLMELISNRNQSTIAIEIANNLPNKYVNRLKYCANEILKAKFKMLNSCSASNDFFGNEKIYANELNNNLMAWDGEIEMDYGLNMQSNSDVLPLLYSPLNQILYGPPGTGKTYHSIEAAVKAAEPQFYSDLSIDIKIGATKEQRKQLTVKYKKLADAGRIRFVTFHQSYGYEEFVEGLRANSKDGDISYDVEPGVFKSICTEAKDSRYQKEFKFKPNAKVWKISIDGTGQSKIRQTCFENNFAAMGWGATGDLLNETSSDDEKTYYESLGPLAKSTLYELSQGAQEGDIVLCIGSKRDIQAVGIVSGDYQYLESGLLHKDYYRHTLPVNWLATDININFYELNGNKDFTQKTFYHLWRFNPSDVFELLKKHDVKLKMSPKQDVSSDNYVLIIDEINRGNMSKIFGELITLIEPSKRTGQDKEIDEALELILPYSGTKFSVPNNLYIIGTMNTADRSLAMMDTALRRRFDFVEMMPDTTLFEGYPVNGIDLQAMLETMNKRIEVLYDREHTLGHAFFMPVKTLMDGNDDNKEAAAFEELKSIFKNKIIPLLEEYFFEDWNKIRLVLGDNRKAESLRFVTEIKQSYDEIFGTGHGLDSYETGNVAYSLASFDGEHSLWNNPDAYRGIYTSVLVKEQSEPEAA